MSIRIAGRLVRKDDRLYHRGFDLWGTVVLLDDASVTVHIQGEGRGNNRRLLVTNGGLVSGVRQMYWHAPLVLDLPQADVSKYQETVDFVRERLL